MEALPIIAERGFPVILRKLYNRLAKRGNRLWRVQFEDGVGAKVLESEENVTLILPRNLSGGGTGGASIQVGFGWYQSPFLGGNPPAAQGLKVRFRDGAVNDNVPVANNDAEFTLLPNVTNFPLLTTYQQSDGIVTHATISIASSVPDDPVGDINIAPATSSRALWGLTTNATGVTNAVALRVGGIDVHPLEYGRTCEGAMMRMAWFSGGAM